jgi:hypothetical protein
MIKAEIQVPNEPYSELRTGAELLVQIDPEPPHAHTSEWTPPTSGKAGWQGLSAGELRDAAFADSDMSFSVCALKPNPVLSTP